MQIFISLVIADASEDGIRTTVSTDPEVIRQDLLEFYTDALNDGGLPDKAPSFPPATRVETLAAAIERWLGQTVILQESWLIEPRAKAAA